MIPVTVSAVDFVDSTGYTPSWAKGAGYHSVLMKCTELIGDYSRDGNWCFEWTAYVLDQGVENFPQSTQGTGSTSIANPQSERICAENKICAFPGEFLKYKTWDTHEDFGFQEIAVVEFKEKINNDNIRFFSDGFGSKPLTYNLNLKTGIETHDEYTGVNRPFNFIEPIPMKIGQNVYRMFEGYYDSKIEAETRTNLKEIGLFDAERVVMAAQIKEENSGIGLVYDKETGVLLAYLEKYIFDGKEYTSGTILISTNIFSVPTKVESVTNSYPSTKESNSLSLVPQVKDNPLVSGDFLEEVSITTENDEYHISGKIGQKSPNVSSIRITAENECPFKKEIFQKDFLYKPGDEVSFSFFQLSSGKPSECAIHFTISNFDGIILETIVANYYLPETKSQSNSIDEHPFSVQSKSPELAEKIPKWVKNIFGWYAADQVSEDELLNAIKYLIKEGILIVE